MSDSSFLFRVFRVFRGSLTTILYFIIQPRKARNLICHSDSKAHSKKGNARLSPLEKKEKASPRRRSCGKAYSVSPSFKPSPRSFVYRRVTSAVYGAGGLPAQTTPSLTPPSSYYFPDSMQLLQYLWEGRTTNPRGSRSPQPQPNHQPQKQQKRPQP